MSRKAEIEKSLTAKEEEKEQKRFEDLTKEELKEEVLRKRQK